MLNSLTVHKRGAAIVAAAALVFVACGTGCEASGPKTTRLQAADLQIAAGTIAEKLAASEFMTARGPDAPPILLALEPATNASSDRLSRVDRLGIVTRVAYSPSMQELFRAKNVGMRVYQQDEGTVRRYGMGDPNVMAALRAGEQPSHVMRAEVRTMTRQAGEGTKNPASLRTDTYFINYSIVELKTGRIQWTGDSEFQRFARGLAAD